MADNEDNDNNNRTQRSTNIRHSVSRPELHIHDDDRSRSGQAQRVRSGSSDRFDVRFPRFRTLSPHTANETTRLLSRDFADQNSITSPTVARSTRNTDFSLPPSSIRRRLPSVKSPSPGPSYSWRSHLDPTRRSVAIAPTINHDDDTESRKFSLAGPAPVDTQAANQPYVDPGYAQLNPAYDQPANVRPVWGFAKPLPRVLRPGMVPAKDELKEELLQQREEHEQPEPSLIDLESGRIEPSLRPSQINNQLDTLRREREIQLFHTFQNRHIASPSFSPFQHTRQNSDAATEVPDPQLRAESNTRHEDTIIEEEEGSQPEREHDWRHGRPSEVDMPQLSQAIANVNRAREEEELKVPYQDAVPLLAYEAEDDEIHNLHTYWSVIRLRLREPLAEALGICVLYSLGFSVNLTSYLSSGVNASIDGINVAWGLAAMTAIYIAGGVSGAHFNPAMSVMLYIYRGFPLRKIPTYLAGQFVGSFCATMIAFGLFRTGLYAMEEQISLQNASLIAQGQPLPQFPSEKSVLANFITFPRHPWVDFPTAFFTEMVGTAILTVSVLALGDDTNAPPGAGMNSFIVGLIVIALGMAFGYNTGLALNPMRDFGPRVALTVLGYGRTTGGPSLFADGYFCLVAWFGPLAGAITGGFIYDAAIFVGGESPVNYPTKRIRRATRKWKKRWRARIGRTKRKVKDVKDDVLGSER